MIYKKQQSRLKSTANEFVIFFACTGLRSVLFVNAVFNSVRKFHSGFTVFTFVYYPSLKFEIFERLCLGQQ